MAKAHLTRKRAALNARQLSKTTWFVSPPARNCMYDDADYFSQRIFSYANKWDFAVYGAGILAAVGAGVTMPLMTVIFGTVAHPVLFVG